MKEVRFWINCVLRGSMKPERFFALAYRCGICLWEERKEFIRTIHRQEAAKLCNEISRRLK